MASELLRVGSYPGVIGVEFLDCELPAESETQAASTSGATVEPKDASALRSHGNVGLGDLTYTHGGLSARALRPGASRFTCGGQVLMATSGNGVSALASAAPETWVPTMSCAPRPSDSCLPASAAELREPVASAFGRSTSPFSADGPSCPESYLPAMAHQSPHQAQAGPVPTWGESSFGIQGLGGSECGAGSMWDCEPVAPARRTAEGLDALSFAFIQSQQPQDQLINRPGLSVSEHPCTLLRAPSGGYSLINTASVAAAAPLDAAAVILPQPVAEPVAAAAPVPAAAATPACSESRASPAPSTDRHHHDATSALTSSGATSSCGGSDMPEDAAAEVQQQAPEAASLPLPQESHVFAASSVAQVEAVRPAEVEQVGPPGNAALAAMRASGRMAAAAAPAPARVGQKRRAAATAAVVVLEAARDDEDDDEDYDEREEAGAGGRGSAKRVKRVGGAPRAATNKPKTGVTCRNCRATETPQWRCGPEGPRTLCNACGVRYKKGQTLEYMAKKAAAAAARGRTGGGDA